MFIPGHSTKATIMIHIIVSNASCADHKHRNYCIFSLSVLREPGWRLGTPILHWTLKLHLLETLGWYIKSLFWDDPPKKKVEDSSQALRPLSFPTQHLHSQITYTWQLFGDSWWHCPDSSCRYWCPMAKQQNWTFWFLACEYQPLSSQQMIRTIHPFKRRWNQLQLPVVKINYSWILGWDFPIPKIPSDQISTPLSNQHII